VPNPEPRLVLVWSFPDTHDTERLAETDRTRAKDECPAEQHFDTVDQGIVQVGFVSLRGDGENGSVQRLGGPPTIIDRVKHWIQQSDVGSQPLEESVQTGQLQAKSGKRPLPRTDQTTSWLVPARP